MHLLFWSRRTELIKKLKRPARCLFQLCPCCASREIIPINCVASLSERFSKNYLCPTNGYLKKAKLSRNPVIKALIWWRRRIGIARIIHRKPIS